MAARKCGVVHDVTKMQQIVPLITCEIAFCYDVCDLVFGFVGCALDFGIGFPHARLGWF